MGFALVGLAAGTRGRRAGRAGLYGDLSRHDARHLRLHPGDAARRRHGRGDRRPRRACAHAIRRWRSSSPMLLFSLAGIPPLAGFFAKFYVFLAAIKAGLYSLAVIGVLASVVGAFYYLPSSSSCISTSRPTRSSRCRSSCGGRAGVSGPVRDLLFFVYPAPLVDGGRRRGEVAVLTMHLDPASCMPPACRLVAHDALGSTNAEALRWRAPASAGRCGSRPRGRPPAAAGAAGLGVGAGQSLRQPAADRPCAAASARRALVRRGARACTMRVGAVAPALAARLALKWPNDLLLDGAKVARHPARGRRARQAARRRHRHRRQLRAAIRPTRPIRRPTLPRAGVARDAGALFHGACPRAMLARLRAMEIAARALPRSAPTGSRAPPASASRSACACRSAS